MRFVIMIFGIVFMAPTLSADATNRHTGETYYVLIYDFEVARFCGLVSKTVHDAFWSKRKIVEKQSGWSIEQLRQTRIRAMAAADIEYANRGLGGYKPWCQNEGKAGIARIISP